MELLEVTAIEEAVQESTDTDADVVLVRRGPG